MRFSPRGLPLLREQMAAGAATRQRWAKDVMSDGQRRACAAACRSASLWWIPNSEKDTLMSGAEQVPDGFVLDTAMPDSNGIMVLDDFDLKMEWTQVDKSLYRHGKAPVTTIDGFWWYRDPGSPLFYVIALSRLTGIDRSAEIMRRSWGRSLLVPLVTWPFFHGEATRINPDEINAVQLLYRIWRTAEQPVAIERVRPPSTGALAVQRRRPHDEVRIVRVPRRVRPDDERSDELGGTGRREPEYRWTVKEHPVTVWCGKGRTEKRTVMRREHTSGPKNKPLRDLPAVHVLSNADRP